MSDYQWSDEHIRAVYTLYAAPHMRQYARDHFDEWLKIHDARVLAEATAEAHARELHHFEAEEALSQILGIVNKTHSQSWLEDLAEIGTIASGMLGKS
jgi:hypothetical protein